MGRRSTKQPQQPSKSSKKASDYSSEASANGFVDKNSYLYVSPYSVCLPRWELTLYFIVWVGHSCYAWYKVWVESESNRDKLFPDFFEPGWKLLGSPRKDVSNYEWVTWSNQAIRYIPWFLGHVLLFNNCQRLMGLFWRHVMLVFWLTANYFVYHGVFVLLVTVFHGCIVFMLSHTRAKLAVWISAIALLGSLSQEWLYGKVPRQFFYEYMVFFAYKLLQYISFCLHRMDPKKQDFHRGYWLQDIFRMFFYSFYLPYNISLIVTYGDFCSQMENRRNQARQWSHILLLILRVLFWALFNDLIPHFIYLNALMQDSYNLARIAYQDLILLASIGYISGQYFHTKYVVVFGLPSIFAELDKLVPPFPPICISRVALYSKMWRGFDRGLYHFLKEHIFLPTVSVVPSIVGRVFATALCFLFVYIWHGAASHFFLWVSLNFAEVLMEAAGKAFYRRRTVTAFFAVNFSPPTIRRLAAASHVPCVAFGIASIFYFIGGTESGGFFVKRLVFHQLPFGAPFVYLLCLGYCFAQCCIEIDRWEQRRH